MEGVYCRFGRKSSLNRQKISVHSGKLAESKGIWVAMSLPGTIYIGMGIIEKIEEILAIEDMKKSVLCRKVGILDSRFSKWKYPKKVPTYPDAYETCRIARVLGVSMEFLADDDRGVDSSLEADRLERTILEKARLLGLDVALARLDGERAAPQFVEAPAPGPHRKTNA